MINLLQKSHFEKVFLIGENFTNTKSGFPTFKSVNEFLQSDQVKSISNAYVLIKGSRFMKMERVIDFL